MSELPLSIQSQDVPSIRVDFAVHFFDRQQTPSLDFAVVDYARAVAEEGSQVTATITKKTSQEYEYEFISVQHETRAIDYLSLSAEEQKYVELLRSKLAEQGLKYTSERGFMGVSSKNMQLGL